MTDESVSNSSKFSIKSQIVIAKQDETIAAMRRAMIAAGLDPDASAVAAQESCPLLMFSLQHSTGKFGC